MTVASISTPGSSLRLPAFLWPASAAIALHAAVGGWWLTHMEAAPHGVTTVFSMSLSPAGLQKPLPQAAQARTTQALPIAPPGDRADQPAEAQPLDAAAESRDTVPVPPHREDVETDAPAASRSTTTTARSAYFYPASELTRLPALPGDPLVDLGDIADEVAGSVALRLSINDEGHVVNQETEGSTGLPAGIVDILTRAFAGYPYVPGEREGQAVNSQVVLLISVRAGQAFTGAAP